MLKIKALAGAVALIAFSLAPVGGNATIYDLNADWSNASNPNGVWTLREGANALPAVADWFGSTLYGSGTQPAWAPSTTPGAFLPAWFKASGTAFDWLAGDIVVHTTDGANGAGFGVANVLFTAPSDGTADLSGSIWNARHIGRPQSYDLLVNGVSQNSGGLSGVTRASPLGGSLSGVVMAAGDTIELRLINAGSFGDFVGVSLTVDFTPDVNGAVPEPSTWAMMLIGFAGLAFAARRRIAARATA